MTFWSSPELLQDEIRRPPGRFAIVPVMRVAEESASQSPGSVWDGIYSAEQARRGPAGDNRQHSSCHGGSLPGGETAPPPAGGELKEIRIEAIKPERKE